MQPKKLSDLSRTALTRSEKHDLILHKSTRQGSLDLWHVSGGPLEQGCRQAPTGKRLQLLPNPNMRTEFGDKMVVVSFIYLPVDAVDHDIETVLQLMFSRSGSNEATPSITSAHLSNRSRDSSAIVLAGLGSVRDRGVPLCRKSCLYSRILL